MKVLIYQRQASLEKYLITVLLLYLVHQNRLHFINLIHEKYNLIIDTHTADGFKAAFDHLDQDKRVPMVVLETALPLI